jgi:rhodanese-related sulfurtransferase
MVSMPVIIKEAAWVILTAVVLTAGGYVLRPDAMVPAAQTLPGENGVEHASGVPAMDVVTAAEHLKKGTAIFADARSAEAYDAGHIDGALHLDPHQFDQWSERVFSEIDPEALIVTYCDGERCALGLELAEKLNWLGFDNVYTLVDGWSAWATAKLPIAKPSR